IKSKTHQANHLKWHAPTSKALVAALSSTFISPQTLCRPGRHSLTIPPIVILLPGVGEQVT
ncbi:MAG TPA: hypothetical protein VFM34_08815, partial [Moraxellaceae bacterium]|nr:hypothetical protein [Moraxellaceae bacterium]